MGRMMAYVRLGVVGLVLSVGCGDDDGTGSPDAPPWNDFEVTSGDVTLHVWTYGGHDGAPVLLLLHGGPGLSHDYLTGFSRYASPELRLVWFDQRGTGLSTQPTTSGYAFADYVADLEAVRSAIGAEDLHLVGHSWGGGYALAYLGAQPQQVASIVLIDSTPPTFAATGQGQARLSLRIQELQADGIIPYPLPTIMNGDCLPRAIAIFPAYLADPATVPPAEFGNMTCRQSPLDMTFIANWGFDLQPLLAGAQTPVSILFGDTDPFGVEWVTQTEAGLPMAAITTVIVTASGHFPWFEQAAQFEPAFRDFLTAQGLELGH